MIVLIGLLVLACLAGAYAAFRLAQPPWSRPSGPARERASALQPWAQVESGPDSVFPLDPGPAGSDPASGRAT